MAVILTKNTDFLVFLSITLLYSDLCIHTRYHLKVKTPHSQGEIGVGDERRIREVGLDPLLPKQDGLIIYFYL